MPRGNKKLLQSLARGHDETPCVAGMFSADGVVRVRVSAQCSCGPSLSATLLLPALLSAFGGVAAR